jgi:hypothetical protein
LSYALTDLTTTIFRPVAAVAAVTRGHLHQPLRDARSAVSDFHYEESQAAGALGSSHARRMHIHARTFSATARRSPCRNRV